MHTYKVNLTPKPGTNGRNLTTQIVANSDSEAWLLAEAQYPGYSCSGIWRIS